MKFVSLPLLRAVVSTVVFLRTFQAGRAGLPALVVMLFAVVFASSAIAAQKLYTCSMHPQIIRTEPGSCPICGMDLTLMVGNAGGGADALSVINVDTRTVQMMNLRTQVLERGAASRDLRTVGVVGFDESTRADVTTRYAGWLEKLYVNKPWQRVSKGEPLFEIYSPALYNAQLNYLVARQSEGKAGGTLTSASLDRLRLLGVSEEFIANLVNSGEAQRLYVYHSPQDGVVIEKLAVQGQMIEAGQVIYQLADISTVWVEAQVFEKDLPLVKAGQAVSLRASSAASAAAFTGEVDQVLPRVQEATRTGVARIVVENVGEALLPGMFTEVNFSIPLGDSVLLVPDEAILRSGAGNTVFIAQEDGGFSVREVELGARTNAHHYIVNSGLNEGDKVVVSGQFMLDSESRLREAIRKMTEAASGADGDVAATPASTAASHSAHVAPAAHATHSGHAVHPQHNHASGSAHAEHGASGARTSPAAALQSDTARRLLSKAVSPEAIVAAARGQGSSCSHCNPSGASAEGAEHSHGVTAQTTHQPVPVSAAEVSAESGANAALLALAFAAADSAVVLAGDDIVGYGEYLPKLNAALSHYLAQAGDDALPALKFYSNAQGLPMRNSLAQARDDFAPFSNGLSAAVRGAGLNQGAHGLHVFECPMVPKVGSGFWLQRRADTVANPFFGAAMLRCGGIVR